MKNKKAREIKMNLNFFKNRKGKEFKINSNLFKNRKGIELQVNFLVMMIIAIVVFGMGIKLVTDMFSGSTELKDNLDKKSEQDMLSYLNSGKVLSIGINRKELKEGETDTFTLGMINKYSKPLNYIVYVEDDFVVVDRNNRELDQNSDLPVYARGVGNWTFQIRPSKTASGNLGINQKAVIPLAFRVPPDVPQGLYSFKVSVYYSFTKTDPNEILYDQDLFNNQRQIIYIEVRN